MGTANFEAVRSTLKENNALETLSAFADLLNDVSTDLRNPDPKTFDLPFLAEALNLQRRVYDLSNKVYQEISMKEIDNKKTAELLGKLEGHCEEYGKFLSTIEGANNNRIVNKTLKN